MGSILEGKNISLKKGGKEILYVEHFAIHKGEIIAVVGPNGAGKSTFLQVLALLQQPTTGEVLFNGIVVNKANSLTYRRRMAVVFQEPLLLNTTVFNNVSQGLKLRGYNKKEIPAKVDIWLEKLGIAHLAQRMPRFLSGGEAQRVNIARAMVLDPEVLFLDEPFTALDFPTRTSLLKEIGNILKETRATAFFVTHDYTEIPYITNTAIVMGEGKIRKRGDVSSLFKNGIEDLFLSLSSS